MGASACQRGVANHPSASSRNSARQLFPADSPTRKDLPEFFHLILNVADPVIAWIYAIGSGFLVLELVADHAALDALPHQPDQLALELGVGFEQKLRGQAVELFQNLPADRLRGAGQHLLVLLPLLLGGIAGKRQRNE